MISEFYSGAPVAAKTNEPLWGWITHPVDGRVAIEVPTEVFWLRESSSDLVFVHGGKVVHRFCSYNDYYGFLCSLECVDEALHYADLYSVDKTSTAEFQVVMTIKDTPVLEAISAEAKAHNARADAGENIKRKWRRFPSRDLTLRVCEDGETRYPSLEERIVMESEVVWTTKSPMISVSDVLAGLRERFHPETKGATS